MSWEEEEKRVEKSCREMEETKKYRELQAAMESVDEILNYVSILDKITSRQELDLVMPRLLESMGYYSMSDRAYLFTWTSPERKVLRMKHEWCAEGVRPTFGEMQNLRPCDIPNWAPRLNNDETIVVMDLDAEKENIPEEYELFKG